MFKSRRVDLGKFFASFLKNNEGEKFLEVIGFTMGGNGMIIRSNEYIFFTTTKIRHR